MLRATEANQPVGSRDSIKPRSSSPIDGSPTKYTFFLSSNAPNRLMILSCTRFKWIQISLSAWRLEQQHTKYLTELSKPRLF